MAVLKTIEKNILRLIRNFDEINDERRQLLGSFSNYLKNKIAEDKKINLIFICTHNSRRSHMSQIWAQTAAEYFGIKNVFCYSGGTETAAFNHRVADAINEIGFVVEKKDNSANPLYTVKYSNEKEPIQCFSKIYNADFNPQNNFAAVMNCSDADENCPVVFGAEARFPIRYEDPKKYDDTPKEKKKYSETCRQIGKEMLFVFSLVEKL